MFSIKASMNNNATSQKSASNGARLGYVYWPNKRRSSEMQTARL